MTTCDAGAEHLDAPAPDLNAPGEQAQHGRLARAGWADETDVLTALDVEGERGEYSRSRICGIDIRDAYSVSSDRPYPCG
jgi:hypothetical protein